MIRTRRSDGPDGPYGVLGLWADAAIRGVRGRHRELAPRHRPDRDGGDGSCFRKVQQTCEAIVDGAARGKTRAGQPRRGRPHIETVPVDSSNLVAACHDNQTSTPRVEFKRSVCDYYGVPEGVYLGLLAAESVGSYHARHIKWGYAYAQIGRK